MYVCMYVCIAKSKHYFSVPRKHVKSIEMKKGDNDAGSIQVAVCDIYANLPRWYDLYRFCPTWSTRTAGLPMNVDGFH